MRWLTPEQNKAYDFILKSFEKKNEPPTIQEIADGTNMSVSLAYRRVQALEKKGYIVREGYRETRNIRLKENI